MKSCMQNVVLCIYCSTGCIFNVSNTYTALLASMLKSVFGSLLSLNFPLLFLIAGKVGYCVGIVPRDDSLAGGNVGSPAAGGSDDPGGKVGRLSRFDAGGKVGNEADPGGKVGRLPRFDAGGKVGNEADPGGKVGRAPPEPPVGKYEGIAVELLKPGERVGKLPFCGGSVPFTTP